ncbi:MAG: site-specific integrase [Alphaproteobacteria bacterium]|nr:site-specific integrase [Alphaproteobacteria bacterium]
MKDWKEAQKIIDRAANHLKPIIYTALYTGMRLGNILELKWDNINLINKTITIKVKDKGVLGGRTHVIPMINKLTDIILQQEKINEFVFNFKNKPIKTIKTSWHSIFFKWEKVKNKKSLKPDDIIFEKQYSKDGEISVYKRVLRNKDLPYTNFHTLRHTAGTWILKETGNLKVTKEILGHKDIKTTLKYAHVLDSEKRQALDSVFK